MGDTPAEEEENAAELKLGKIFDKVQAYTNSEIAIAIRQYVQKHKDEQPDYQVPPMLRKTQQYVETFSSIKNPEAATEVRSMLSKYNLRAFELSALANLAPHEVDEAKALIPSLVSYPDEELATMLNDLETYKKFE